MSGRKLRKTTQRKPGHAVWRNCGSCGYAINTEAATCPRCSEPIATNGKKPRKKQSHFEDDHQRALFDWASKALGLYPELEWLHAVPNGGARDGLEAGRLKAQGVKAGVLDIGLDHARCGYHGLRIELKATRAELGRAPVVSPAQGRWMENLVREGYRVELCEGWDAAREAIIAYMSGPKTRTIP